MRLFTLFLLATLVATSAGAASYMKRDCTIVDLIQSVNGGDLPYAGNNLEPSANLTDANLRYASLYGANLYGADLYGADLKDADLC